MPANMEVVLFAVNTHHWWILSPIPVTVPVSVREDTHRGERRQKQQQIVSCYCFGRSESESGLPSKA